MQLGRRKRQVIGLLSAGLLAIAVACGGDGDEVSPWLYCTTNPCQPLALLPLPTPPALTYESSLAATCDASGPGADDGVLLWHTDWDPLTEEGICVSREEAERSGAP